MLKSAFFGTPNYSLLVLEQKGKLYQPGKDDDGKPTLELLEL